MITAVNLQTRYDNKFSAKKLRTVHNFRVQADPLLNVSIQRQQVGFVWSYGFNDGVNDRGVVSEADAATVITRIEALSLADHKDAKQIPAWQTLYHQGNRAMKYMAPNGAIADGALQVTYPCHYCGIILPEELIQVDHHKPQAFPGLGVLKVFHSLSMPNGTLLTTNVAQGVKNTQINILLGLAMGPLTSVPVKGRAFAAAWAEKGPDLNRDARYTLTDTGKTILTLIEMLQSGAAERWGVHNLLNLVPACPKCNNAKSGKRHAV